MIRFCDKEVICIMDDELDRQQLISFFLNGHRNEIICVLDKEERFVGSITYDSILGKELEDSVIKRYVVLDENIWENGRKYFRNCRKEFGGIEYLPVLTREHFLLCFAWQDQEANRELRMLDELIECENALDFNNVYPEYDCVTVHGFNELAYRFVKYLKGVGVPVNVCGSLWGKYGIWEKTEILDYKNFTIYGEGVEHQEEIAELRDSVSAEFECIDHIYEENISKGIIRNVEESFSEIIDRLRGRQIAILGTGENALNAYDVLLGYGLDINCFISEDDKEQKRIIFGKEVLSREKAIAGLDQIVFIDVDCKYSAWGFGQVNLYHYYGYRRNKLFFLLQDYIEIPKNGLLNILRYMIEQTERKVVLAGDFSLCLRLQQILEDLMKEIVGRVVYCDFLEQSGLKERKRITHINKNMISKDDICFIVIPECHGRYNDEIGSKQLIRDKLLEKILETGITDIIDYFTENDAFLSPSGINTKAPLTVSKIVIGAINYYSGNTLLRSILDNHPDILMMDYSYLNDNLFSVCLRLSLEKGTDILSLFWKIFYEAGGKGSDQVIEKNAFEFNKHMKRMLTQKETFTSQELFIILHVAYSKMLGRDVKDASQMMIYWEPHEVSRDMCEHYALWLCKGAHSLFIVNMVRNAYIRLGSVLKNFDDKKIFSYSGRQIFQTLCYYPNAKKKKYEGWQRIVIKFENLKCNKYEELQKLCRKIGINWSETLLETTANGKQRVYKGVTTGFDLAPVYNIYEEYFSIFDRFRISLIMNPWQKKYGYPYVSSLNFTRQELKKMFSKEFRFEEKLIFQNEEERMRFRRWAQRLTDCILWETRCVELMEKIMKNSLDSI